MLLLNIHHPVPLQKYYPVKFKYFSYIIYISLSQYTRYYWILAILMSILEFNSDQTIKAIEKYFGLQRVKTFLF